MLEPLQRVESKHFNNWRVGIMKINIFVLISFVLLCQAKAEPGKMNITPNNSLKRKMIGINIQSIPFVPIQLDSFKLLSKQRAQSRFI
jgi:hypothetical protein